MKLIVTLVLLVSVFSGSGQENALKTIGGAAKKKVEAQDFNTTRNNRENLNSDKKAKSSEAPASSSAPAPAPVPDSAPGGAYQNSYQFDANFTYLIETDKEKTNPMSITYFLGENVFRAMISPEMSLIMDAPNKTIINISESSKTAVVMSTDRMNAMMGNTMNDQGNTEKPIITKTGKTKVILGYTCEEYVSKTTENTTSMWIAKNTGVDFSEAFASFMKNQMKQNSADFSEGGLMMEMTTYNKAGVQTAHLLMTALKKEVQQFFLGAYKITRL